jgi:RND family efflux transporter MFP subunit
MNTLKAKIIGLFKRIAQKKILAGTIIIILVGIIYFGYQTAKGNNNVVRYTTEAVTKGTLIVSVTGTGQVNSSNQVDLKPKASGQITTVNVTNGQQIKAGAIIAQIDAKDAKKAVRDATLNLQNAQLSLQKLKQPTDEYTVSQAKSDLEQAKLDLTKLQKPPEEYDLLMAQNAVTQAERDLQQAKDDSAKTGLDTDKTLQKAYDDGYTAVSNAYLDLPDMVKDAWSVQLNSNASISNQDNVYSYKLILGEYSPFITSMIDEYNKANDLFHASFENFKTVSRTTDQTETYKLLDDTLTTAKAVSRALESARNMLDAIVNKDYKIYYIAPTVDLLRPLMETDISNINKDITALQDAKDTIDTTNQNSPFDVNKSQDAITAAEDKLKEKKASLANLKEGATSEDIATAQAKIKQRQDALDKLLEGADALDIKVEELNIKQRENALYDANQTLGDYTVIAPFDCVVAEVNISKGDTVSSGTSIATVISKKMLAEISLNEIDAAKIKNGQKATLTFDAIENLGISGDVVEIDTLGTVNQGVVTYNVKIAFDTQDERIKSGMSVSAAIITDVKQDVLLVPNAAVKTQNEVHYVEMLDSTSNTNQPASNSSTVTSEIPPKQRQIEIGLANETNTEVTSGLNEGDQVVTKTSNSSKTTTASSTTRSGFNLPGMGGGPGR